jgi:hypothetical protein
MNRRLFSLVAIPLSLIGHLVFWAGSAGLIHAVQIFAPLEPVSVILVGAGILVILAAMATVAVGSLGVIVIGALQVVFSLMLLLMPISLRGGGFSPAFDLMIEVRSFNREISDGMFYYVPTGMALVTGVIFLVAGLAAHSRRTVTPGIPARIVSGLVGLVGVLGVALALAGGSRLYVNQLVRLDGMDPVGLVQLLAGSALLAAAVLAARWSSAGALVAGAIIAVVGLIPIASPIAVFSVGEVWEELRRGLDIAGASASLLLTGLLLVIAGLAIRVRARRAAGLPAVVSGSAEELPPPTTAPSV